MTAAGDYVPANEDQEYEVGPTYPVAFGVELTPKVQGILLALLGLVGAWAIWNFLIQPTQEEREILEVEVQQKQQQLEQQRAQLANRDELEAQLDQALNNRIGVYSLLGDAASLDTLLLDINQQINNSNAALNDGNVNQAIQTVGYTPAQIQVIRSRIAANPKLQTYFDSKLSQFDPQPITLVDDGSLGTELDGKLERQQVSVSLEALFPQTQSILRNLERLEPLVVVRDFDQSIASPPSGVTENDLQGLARPLETNFTLEVLVPVNNPAEPPPVPEPEPVEAEAGATPAGNEGGAESPAPEEGD